MDTMTRKSSMSLGILAAGLFAVTFNSACLGEAEQQITKVDGGVSTATTADAGFIPKPNLIVTEPAGAACPNGGVRIRTGTDDNGDGVLDENESDVRIVCSGQPGQPGTNAAVRVSDEPPGANCANGGQRIESGLDANDNGTLDESEVVSTDFVCNGEQGQTGMPGANALVRSVVLSPGDSVCPHGGVRVNSGIDDNGDGVLDESEVVSTAHVCNGAPAQPCSVSTRTATTGATCFDFTCPPNPPQEACISPGTSCSASQDGLCSVTTCTDGTTSRVCPPPSPMATCTSTQTSMVMGDIRRDCLVQRCDLGNNQIEMTELFCINTPVVDTGTCERGTLDCQCNLDGTCDFTILACEERVTAFDSMSGLLETESRCVLPSGCPQGDLGCDCHGNGACNFPNLICEDRTGFGWYRCELVTPPPPVDAGVDAGFVDSGAMPDAGQPMDTGIPDMGTVDVGQPDSGVMLDAGQPPSVYVVELSFTSSTAAQIAQWSPNANRLRLHARCGTTNYMFHGDVVFSNAMSPPVTVSMQFSIPRGLLCRWHGVSFLVNPDNGQEMALEFAPGLVQSNGSEVLFYPGQCGWENLTLGTSGIAQVVTNPSGNGMDCEIRFP